MSTTTTTTPPTALITGATGLLGHQLLTTLHLSLSGYTIIGTGLTRALPPLLCLDLLSPSAILQTLSALNPTLIIHCAANRNPSACAQDPAAAYALNVTATKTLAEEAAARGALMLYISTDYVFSGLPGEAPYSATATPRPGTVYGMTKLEGERAVEEAYRGAKGRGVVLRVPVLYGKAERRGESEVGALVGEVWRAQGEVVGVDDWERWWPTGTEDVGRVVVDIARLYTKTLASGDEAEIERLPTILQFSSEDVYTKYEMCKVFAEILGLGLEKMRPDRRGNEGNEGVQRPYDCHLSTKELRDLGIKVHTMDFRGWWRWELRAVRH